ncbi:MAG: monooxygenase YjiB [Roseiflexaceae bacterium]
MTRPDDPRLNPFPWYQTMRAAGSVQRDQRYGDWGIFGYDAAQEAISNHAVFSSQLYGSGPPRASDPFAASMLNTDPPRHRQLRSLVTQAFTPRAIEALTPRIVRIVDELLDAALAGGRFEAIHDLGAPLPVIVIAEMLGIPTEDRARFKLWSDAIVSFGSSAGMSGFTAQREMVAYFMGIIEQRRRAPGDDLISGLLQAEIGGEHLSLPELLGFCALLLVAGNETTTNLIGNALLCFAERPEVWERLRANPDLVPQAVEEVIRFRSPVQAMYRVTTQAFELGDKTIPAHASVAVYLGSANHDETRFTAPEQFDLDRQPNRHLGFGHGIHYCLGAPLARLEGRIALTALLGRVRALRRTGDTPLEGLDSPIVYGVRRLPLAVELG